MKYVKFAAASIFMLTTSAHAGSIRVYNNDSNSHEVVVKCGSNIKSLEIDGSKTGTYTFHSSQSKCEISGGSVSFPVDSVENGQKWKIKNGRAKRY